jgi:hypothetical protein
MRQCHLENLAEAANKIKAIDKYLKDEINVRE